MSMFNEYHRCAYCANFTATRTFTGCAQAYQIARDAGLPVKGVYIDGKVMAEVELSDESGAYCEGYELMSFEAMADEFGHDVATAAHCGFTMPDGVHDVLAQAVRS